VKFTKGNTTMFVLSLLDTDTLLGVFTHTEPLSNYWRSLTVQSQITSDDEFIDMEKVSKSRKLAPLVVPMAEGRPIYEEASALSRFKTAYVKPKDAVDPSRVIKKRPGNMFGAPQTMEQRYDSILADIAQDHRDTIERRIEWLVAKAVIDGKVTLSGEGYPTRMIDFGRDAGHSVVKLGTARWNQVAADIIGDLNSWIATMRVAKFGGPTSRLTLGANVVAPFLADAKVREQLDTTLKNSANAALNLGLREGTRNERLGSLGNVEIWVNADTYEENGVEQFYLDPNTVVLTGPNLNVVEAFGAILDKKAGLRAMPLFPKMWDSEDPSVTQLMTQSAPLGIPVNPNNSFKAVVL
jgi:hypothetical protein